MALGQGNGSVGAVGVTLRLSCHTAPRLRVLPLVLSEARVGQVGLRALRPSDGVQGPNPGLWPPRWERGADQAACCEQSRDWIRIGCPVIQVSSAHTRSTQPPSTKQFYTENVLPARVGSP